MPVQQRVTHRLGQPARCRQPGCRRLRRCVGEAPDCWRDLPAPSMEETELAKGLWRYHLREYVVANDPGGDA